MAQIIARRLAAVGISSKAPGYHADGANLYLRVAPGGHGRGWIFRFSMAGRTRDMGLGSYPGVSLATARELAEKFRTLVKEGVDPIEHRRTLRAAQRLAAAKSLTFDECAREYIKEHEADWRNAKHRAQWTSTLTHYASPVFGQLPVAAVDVGLVLKALKPIWNVKRETASRLRGRIEAVLDWARVHGYRTAENAARWKGNLEGALPYYTRTRIIEHHPALPHAEIGGFMKQLRARCDDRAASALEFTILTAARTAETTGATWDEIDLAAKVWKIPATRMKGGREHRVPFSQPALRVLERMQAIGDKEFVFPRLSIRQPLNNSAMLHLLRRMGRADLTVHGFRSTFRDWAAERTNFPREVVEMALAHRVGTEVELAYRRSDYFERRRQLMARWADYCSGESQASQVLHLPRRGQQ
jgi:integrase